VSLTPEAVPRKQVRRPAQELERRVAWVVVVVPLAGFLLAVACLWGKGISRLDLGLCLGLAVVSLAGVTAGYHRLFTHQSFQAHSAVRWVLGVAGSMAAQGPLLFWVACHRRHHQHSDTADDPHSPRHGGPGVWGWLCGLWYAHVGWMFHHEPEPWGRYVPDLLRDDLAFHLNRTYPVWVLLGLALPAVVGGRADGWTGAGTGLLWGGLVRIFLVHHVSWSINSLCHAAGGQPYDTGDDSRNNVLFGLLALGEGWHNNHHAFPTSARHGLAWWQLDLTWLLIRLLGVVGLAWDIRRPPPELYRRRLLGQQAPAAVGLSPDALHSGGITHECPGTDCAERVEAGDRPALRHE
jgi:stearoyl-CoA desaturase (delta-9 desaturase)